MSLQWEPLSTNCEHANRPPQTPLVQFFTLTNIAQGMWSPVMLCFTLNPLETWKNYQPTLRKLKYLICTSRSWLLTDCWYSTHRHRCTHIHNSVPWTCALIGNFSIVTIKWLIMLAELLTYYIYQAISCLIIELLVETKALVFVLWGPNSIHSDEAHYILRKDSFFVQVSFSNVLSNTVHFQN